jgi:hypothetical protein
VGIRVLLVVQWDHLFGNLLGFSRVLIGTSPGLEKAKKALSKSAIVFDVL